MTTGKSGVSTAKAALSAACPRCGKGALFRNVLELRPRCDACGLDYAFIDTGDGPAVFAILILGFIALGGVMITHLVLGVPLWATYLAWGIATPLIALAILRLLKATLIALQYRNKAEEGRLANRE